VKKLNLPGLVIVLLFITALTQYADTKRNEAKQDTTKAHTSAKHKITVTGCLQNGDKPGDFLITGNDGNTWDVGSSTFRLDQLVGSKLTISGTPRRDAKVHEKKASKEGEIEKAAKKERVRDLRPTSIKLLSDSCK
jgi:hypothetical protein